MTDKPKLKEIQEAKKQKDIEKVKFVNIKIKKLKLAKALAFTQGAKKKVIDNSEELLDDVDSKIKSLALSKFAIRKVKRLKDLGGYREDINTIIDELHAADDSLLDKALKTKLGFGIDKRFIKLTADEVLDKIGYMPKNKKEESKEESKEEKEQKDSRVSGEISGEITDDVIKQVTDAITKEAKDLDIELTDEEMQKVTDAVVSKAMDIAIDEVANNISINDNIEEMMTPEKIQQTNEKIYDYLVKSGELEAADFVLERMTKPEPEVKNLSEIEANTKEIQRLSVINSGILEQLDEIKENMVDEQDTSVTLPEKLKKESQAAATPTPEKKKEGNWLMSLLGMLFGPWIAKLLGMRTLGALALRILGAGLGFIKDVVKGLFKSLWKLSIAPIQKAIDMIMGILNKIPGVGKALSLAGKVVKGATMGVAALGAATGLSGLFSPKAKAALDGPDKLSDGKDKVDAEKKKANIDNKKTPELSKSKMPPIDKKGAGIARKLLRFAKPIPLIGTVIAAGTAIYSAVDGYNNAAEYINKPESALTVTDKLASAAGALVEDVTFGIIDKKKTANMLLRLDDDEFIKKFEELGIVKRVDEEPVIANWDTVQKLPIADVQELLSIDSFNDEDKAKLSKVFEAAVARDGLIINGLDDEPEKVTNKVNANANTQNDNKEAQPIQKENASKTKAAQAAESAQQRQTNATKAVNSGKQQAPNINTTAIGVGAQQQPQTNISSAFIPR